jgi:uncharacterized protein
VILNSYFFRERRVEPMELSGFTVILTDQCNFDCAYCYQQRGKQRLEFSVLIRAIDFFHSFFGPECSISFYGGEPLLAFNELKQTVEYVERLSKKNDHKIRYSLTTNGSRLDEDILRFLDEHEFSMTLSFDGLAQDISRKKGSFDCLVSLIPQILARPRISLLTNSVFSSETIGYLSESVKYIIRLGVPKLDVGLAHKPPWTSSSFLRLKEEMARVGEYFESSYKNLQDVPWPDFYKEPEKAVYRCPAGLNQMVLSAQGTLWGCVVFSYYFREKKGTTEYQKFCFGDVDSFVKNPQHIRAQKIPIIPISG